ncbi:hypothetical protein [Nocardioides sp. cx-173]|uniref:hypothetical protein n=1 Tax=Nocardioides sp. cx-173 TaxID=2898796 RepID=UPI001E401072|nr:hypothetical protein [Nocardioides sp. cx-173]MCD4523591.1 hypothetical protein [Nocardioides sp. cx-173]UGB42073.1 hypothetical protein LQ940_00740 [Nocardioides sp. cx-173]
MSSPETTDYRLARSFAARFVGAYLLLLAIVMFAATAAVAVTQFLPPDALVVLLVLGLVGLAVLGARLRSAYVVSFDAEGYRVRMVRGAGVKQAAWTEVAEAGTASPRGVPCVVIRLRDGRSTTIPVQALETDREQFVRDLARRLERGEGLRPL